MEEDQLTGIYLKCVNMLESDFFICEPSVEAYLYDKSKETCIKADSSPTNLFSYTSPYVLTNEELETRSNNWKRLLVIGCNFSQLNSESKIFFFEICKTIQQGKNQELDKIRVAWAFLIPLASDGSMNTNKNLKLQLYKVRKKCKISHQDCNILHLYLNHKRKKLFGCMEILVKGVVASKVKPLEEKKVTTSRTINGERLAEKILSTPKHFFKTWEWSRLPSQSCKVPNKIHKTLNLGKNGSSCIQFSRKGLHVAAAILSQILVFDVMSGEEVITLNSHIGFIYELDWSPDDQYLLSVSNDCSGAVWSLDQKTPLCILPHPSYVYCGRWFGSSNQIITGGRDHLVRHWSKNGDFDLIEEIPGHSGFVSALAVQDSLVFSGDSHGFVMIRKFSEGNWSLIRQITFQEIPKNVIDSILTHSSSRRIIVSVRSRSSYLVDATTGIILQTYESAVNPLARSLSCLTPCGSFLFSFCQNGHVGVWEVNTGKLCASYDNLFIVDRLFELSGSIHYHPHEHMVGITALGQSYPLFILKYDSSKEDDSKKLGLNFFDKRMERNFNLPVLLSKSGAREECKSLKIGERNRLEDNFQTHRRSFHS